MNVLFWMKNVKILFFERNTLVTDNKRLNAKIDALDNCIDIVEENELMTHNFHHPWSKAQGLGSKFLKPVVHPLKELQNVTFMGDVPNHTNSDTPVSPLFSQHET